MLNYHPEMWCYYANNETGKYSFEFLMHNIIQIWSVSAFPTGSPCPKCSSQFRLPTRFLANNTTEHLRPTRNTAFHFTKEFNSFALRIKLLDRQRKCRWKINAIWKLHSEQRSIRSLWWSYCKLSSCFAFPLATMLAHIFFCGQRNRNAQLSQRTTPTMV